MNTDDTEYSKLNKYSKMFGQVLETHLYMT